jgi:hypothetical protein
MKKNGEKKSRDTVPLKSDASIRNGSYELITSLRLPARMSPSSNPDGRKKCEAVWPGVVYDSPGDQ